MKTIYLDYNTKLDIKNLSLCLGFFDGMHEAHQALMDETLKKAKEGNVKSGLMTFSDHILSIIKHQPFQYLSSVEDKREMAEQKGFDYFFVLNVTTDLIHLGPNEFICRFLCDQRYIVVGFDFTFGSMGKGNTTLLKEQTCFETVEMHEMLYLNEKIGSSRIRQHIRNGELKEANYLLTYPYTIKGEVIHGKDRGKALGFPTANIKNPGYLMPKDGVYFVKVKVKGKRYFGLLNVGNNPTFDDVLYSIEVYIIDFNEDIYHEPIELYILEFLRDELKFESKQDLMDAMNLDLENAKSLIEGGLYEQI